MKSYKARLEIPSQDSFLGPATGFVISYAAQFDRGAPEQERLQKAVSSALAMVMENNAHGKSEEAIAIEVGEFEGKLKIGILNRGLPILLGSGKRSGLNSAYFEKFNEAFKHAERISVENSGRKGQVVVLEFGLGAGAAAKSLGPGSLEPGLLIPEGETVTIRGLAPGEEEALSRLFYLVYGYNYINEIVYYPEKLKAMIEAGNLLPIVAARPNGRLVGHVGLVRKRLDPLVYEAAMGVVDPAIKSRGLFGQIFQKIMEKAKETPMQYCLLDFVTNHEYSQKHVAKYGACDMAIFVGCQSRETQARLSHMGLGSDPQDMDRYSLLVSILPRAPYPLGQEVSLPESIGEPFGFLLKPLGLSWSPCSRFQTLPPQGQYKARFEPTQSAVIFDLFEPGLKAAEGLLEEWRRMLRSGFQYAAVDVPLSAKGVGTLYELLSSNGFFAAGFVPYQLSGQLGFRFQALGPTKVAFDKIKVASESGRRLLDIVCKDYEASCLI